MELGSTIKHLVFGSFLNLLSTNCIVNRLLSQMTNDMDHMMSAVHSSSVATKNFTAQNGVTKDALVATGDAATMQQAMQLVDQDMRELLKDDPNSTVGQPGDPSTQKYVYAPPRNVIVMPNSDHKHPACFKDSWWSQKLVPVPKREIDLTGLAPKKLPPAGISEKDIKYPPSIKNFPIHFDRSLGYREFLS